MKKCIILSRVSSQGQSLDSQTQAIKNEAVKCGFTESQMLIIEDKESAIKLSEEERHGLNEMKRLIENDSTITDVFIYELSRLSRRQLVLFSIRDYLIEHNIQLTCCTPYFKMLENGKLSQTSNLMFSIFASMSESEMELKKERMKRGRDHNKMTGKISEGKPLLGYTITDDKTIIIEPETSQFIRDIFTLYATGQYSIVTLAKEMLLRQDDDSITFNKMRSRIAFTLKQERYCGSKQYPQLISRELWEKTRRAAKNNNIEPKYYCECTALLKKLIFSKRNGKMMTYSAIKGHHRYEAKYEPPMVTIMTKYIDQYVFELAKALHTAYILDDGDIKKELKEKRDLTLKKMMNSQVTLKKLRERIDNIEERLIFGKLSRERADSITADIQSQINNLENEKKRMEEEIGTLEVMIESKSKKELPDYDNLSYEEKKSIIRQVIRRVEIEKVDRYNSRAYIYTLTDHFIYIIDMNNLKRTYSMKSTLIH